MATSIRAPCTDVLNLKKKKEQNSAFIFFKPLSNSDSCYDVFYYLILSFLMQGHLPFMASAV